VSSRRAAPAKQAPSRKPPPMRKPVSGTPAWVVPAAVLAGIALVVATFLIIRWYNTPAPPPPPSTDTTQAVVTQITTLPPSEFEAVGQGTANNLLKPVSGSPLTGSTGKPEVLYIGAEYCPFCAAQRWALIVALSRFGTFSGLKTTTSSSSDAYANTPTFTFHGATYTSRYIDFRAVETADREQQPLETPSSADEQVFSKYDTAGSIPFLDFGNRYALTGATFSPDVLGGQSWQAIADELKDPSSTQAKAIVGSANLLAAAICKSTSDQPASVCSTATIQGLEKKLG
jgi:hypothetical protein